MTDGEPVPTGVKEIVKNELPVPIGERIIGTIDPKTLTEEQFNNSPELLLHGADKPFRFSQDINYSIFSGPYSATVGRGIYTTDDKVAAEKYVADRRISEGANAVLMRFLPFEARVFDMRTQGNETINAPVPPEFFTQYRQFVIDYFKSRFPNGQPDISQFGKAEWNLYETLSEHKSFLNKVYFKNGEGNYKPIDLRVMLGTDGTMNTSEKGSIPFTLFMLKQGYDGLIYHEDGDGWSETAPSFVFYNPKKVGTYETWHKGDLKTETT
jgi:hypothetical protein